MEKTIELSFNTKTNPEGNYTNIFIHCKYDGKTTCLHLTDFNGEYSKLINFINLINKSDIKEAITWINY